MSNYCQYPPNMGNYTYIPGFGFIPLTAQDKERMALRTTFSGVSVGLLIFMLLELIAPIAIKDMLKNSAAASGFAETLQSDELAQIITLLSVIICGIACFAAIKCMIKIPFAVAVPHKVPIFSYWVCSAAIFQGILALGIFVSQFAERMLSAVGIFPVYDDLIIPSSKLSAVVLVLNLSLFTPVFEELIFRGIVMQSLRRFGDGFAVLISATAFALLHRNPFSFPYAFLSGLLFGFFAIKAHSLFIPIFLHSINNATAVMFELLSSTVSDTFYSVFFNIFLLVSLIAAVAGCFYLLKTRRNAFVISTAPTELPLGKKLRVVFSSVPAIVLIIVVLIVSANSFVFN